MTASSAARPKRRGPATAVALGVLLGVLCLVAAACGSSNGEPLADGAQAPDPAQSRPVSGIAAAGGVFRSGPSCPGPGQPQAPGTAVIAWIAPSLERLAEAGLETLALDDPSLIVEAYIGDINARGGISGTCLALVTYSWDFADVDGSLRRVCTELPESEPLVLMGLWMNDTTLKCAAAAAQIPTVGVFTSLPGSSLQTGAGGVFLDDGSREHLLAASLEVAAVTEVLTGADRVGLLVGDDAAERAETARSDMQRLGLEMVALSEVPAEFGAVGVSAAERQVRLLESGLTDSEMQEGLDSFSRLSPPQAEVLRQMERHFLDTAERFRVAGVTVVVSSAAPADVRRLMRAADLLGWHPRWVIDDSQPAALTLSGAPPRQARNLVQISSRRAAGDQVPDSDRACVSLRNQTAGAAPFAHRAHSDAWNLITATCDSLDVVFAAMTQTAGPLTREMLITALTGTDYETAHGSRIRFGPDDRDGADRFRVLKADPDCVLDAWGCMRATSGWSAPAG